MLNRNWYISIFSSSSAFNIVSHLILFTLILGSLQACKFSAANKVTPSKQVTDSSNEGRVSVDVGLGENTDAIESGSSNTSFPDSEAAANQAEIKLVPGAYYVSPSGSNEAPGSEKSPWKTLKYAFAKLSGGDTLYVRAGTYWESELEIESKGSSSKPIRILNFPNEKPVIDGGLKKFRIKGNSDWDLVDKKNNIHGFNLSHTIYVSKNSFSDSDGITQGLTSVSGKFEYKGKLYSLIRYDSVKDFSADNEFVGAGYRYVGPGVFFDDSTKKIYVRLQPSSRESLNGVYFGIPSSPNPADIKMYINDKNVGLRFQNGASNISFEGIDLANFYHGVRVYSGHHLSFKHLSITMNYAGIILAAGTHNITVDNVEFNGMFPKWLAWTDMKGGDGQHQPVPAIKPVGVTGTGEPLIHDIEISSSLFNDVFDGHTMDGYNINIHHNTYTVSDDMIQLGTNSYNVEIHHNMIIGPGPSHNGRGHSSKFPGTKYIHHNVIDASTPILWGRKDPSEVLRESYTGWQSQVPFPSHKGSGPGDGDPWKIYHNTILQNGIQKDRGMGHHLWQEKNETNVAHEVYNNIFIQYGQSPIIDRQSSIDGLQIYDANIYFQSGATKQSYLFAEMDTSEGEMNFHSLSDFLSSSAFDDSERLYGSGWDLLSMELDPKLNNPLERDYRPSAQGPATGNAKPLDRHNFPGIIGESFIGALDPNSTATVGR